ncbi:MAG: alpha/beta hydrolase [Deltaproteobacteria bacterium]|nr:alpha/beta hydrolase [Deltaproteobacteria bacterium]
MTAFLALLLAAAPAPAKPGVYRRAAISADGLHLAVYLYVPERPLVGAPPVLLVPDLGTTHDIYDVAGEGLARELASRGLTVETFDWRGTGLSQVPDHDPTLDELLAQDLPTAASALGDRPMVLLGWGFGGALAYAAAVGPLKAQTHGIIALNAVVDADVPNAIVERLFASGDALDLSRELASPAPQRRGSLFDLLWVHGATLDATEVNAVQAHALAPLSASQVAQLNAWMHARTTTLGGKPYPDQLSELDVPVLALLGMRDNWSHPEFASTIHDHAPKSHVELKPLTTFEGYREDPGHLGLILGRTAREQLAPLMVDFVRAQTVMEVQK